MVTFIKRTHSRDFKPMLFLNQRNTSWVRYKGMTSFLLMEDGILRVREKGN